MSLQIPDPVRLWLQENGFRDVVSLRSVGGGCINNGAVLQTASGDSFFLKTNPQAPLNMFEREAEGLVALRTTDGPRVPKPFCSGDNFLLLENLSPASPRPGYWTEFGRKLAFLHDNTNAHFGFQNDNYIGSTPQPNPWMEDGYAFFAQHRLLFQARLAQERNQLGRAEVSRVERIAARLPELIPAQPASLIHGDLWSGNTITDERGDPSLIDPATHYGWAEAELGMTSLFGSFPQEFYRSYQEMRPLETGIWERFPIYNLYHLLNHLNLFGSGYLGQVARTLRQFG